MKRFPTVMFLLAVLLLSWLGMQAVHELGHVLGSWLTGGTVQRVVLSPLEISRTDVSPNPHPLVVVWLGPIIGCLLPLMAWRSFSSGLSIQRNLAQFFAGFCCIANGAYLTFGLSDRIGDCGVLLQCGAPAVVIVTYGVAAIVIGIWLWHRLGSPMKLFAEPTWVTAKGVCIAWGLLLLIALSEWLIYFPTTAK